MVNQVPWGLRNLPERAVCLRANAHHKQQGGALHSPDRSSDGDFEASISMIQQQTIYTLRSAIWQNKEPA